MKQIRLKSRGNQMDKEKVRGALFGLAIGDAMGAPTELRTQSQIKRDFGGFVTKFYVSPADTFARGYAAGTVTDDFSMSYYLMKEIMEAGEFNETVAKKSIIAWGADPIYFDKFAGPTTRGAIENLQAGLPTDVDPWGLINYSNLATNGGAMKTIPIALLANGDWQLAIKYAIELCLPTHFNSNAISGAAAIACAATEALNENTTIDRIIEAGIWGAEEGKKYGCKKEHISVGPDIAYLIKTAVEIGGNSTNIEELLVELDQKIGTTFQVVQSVPCVFGILKGTNGNLMKGIYSGVNIGGDTDTIAAMVGGILGALQGDSQIPTEFIETILEANPTLSIQKVVDTYCDLLNRQQQTASIMN